jgi:hypothetical protein
MNIKTSKDQLRYLTSVGNICHEYDVGCVNLTDTKNTFVKTDDVQVAVVYNEKMSCAQSDKGCERFGPVYYYGSDYIFLNDVYIKNDPDIYGLISCSPDEVGCAKWSSDKGDFYFKDPGEKTCSWKQNYAQQGWNWWQTNVKRCEDTFAFCLKDDDCEGSAKCLENVKGCEITDKFCATDDDCPGSEKCIEKNEFSCPVDSELPKTMGFGGNNHLISQPANGWAGFCPSSESSCTEYIDPLSHHSFNMVNNPDFKGFGGWEEVGGNKRQKIDLEPATLYVLTIINNDAAVVVDGDKFYKFDLDDNKLGGLVDKISVSSAAQESVLFFTRPVIGPDTKFYIEALEKSDTLVSVKKSLVNYQHNDKLDKTSCNGIYDIGEGCVLFNERDFGSDGFSKLFINVDQSKKGEAPKADSPIVDSNSLIKVKPDRICNKWLACKTYIKDEKNQDYCFDLGICSSFDVNNECANFIIENSSPISQSLENPGFSANNIQNLTGYSKVAYNNYNLNKPNYNRIPNDQYNLGEMKQDGAMLSLVNGGFELYGSNAYPIGWSYDGDDAVIRHFGDLVAEWRKGAAEADIGEFIYQQTFTRVWNDGVFKVINNPYEASQSEGVCYISKDDNNCLLYNPEGRSFLRLGAIYNAISDTIDVIPGHEYYLSAYINTKNLTSGNALITILDSNNSLPIKNDEGEDYKVSLKAARPWTLVNLEFKPQVNSIKIKLEGEKEDEKASLLGKIYYDDIQIKPVLKINDGWHVPQDCRLYPENNALSCDYYGDSGLLQKGWQGYCLEYDQYPGKDNACLMWYPIDKVKGQGIEEGGGYAGRFPLYFCAEADMNFSILESRKTARISRESIKSYTFIGNVIRFNWSAAYKQLIEDPFATFVMVIGSSFFGPLGSALGSLSVDSGSGSYPDASPSEYGNCWGSGCGLCPFGYFHSRSFTKKSSLTSKRLNIFDWCVPVKSDYVTTARVTDSKGNSHTLDWYQYNGDLQVVGGGDENEKEESLADFIQTISSVNKDKKYSIDYLSDETGTWDGMRDLKKLKIYFHDTREMIDLDEAYKKNRIIQCRTVYKVVNDTGKNKAWFNRVSSDTGYKINMKENEKMNVFSNHINIDIGYNTHNIPFGAMSSQIFPIYNPYEWDGNTATHEYEPITVGANQAGGTAMGCYGENCKRLGLCSQSGMSCLAYTIVGSLAINHSSYVRHGNAPNFIPHYLASFHEYPQLNCPKGEFCIPLDPDALTIESAKEKLKRVFAKNYGVWQYDEYRGRCDGGVLDGLPCTNNENCISRSCLNYCFGNNRYYNTACNPEQYYKYDPDKADTINNRIYLDCISAVNGDCVLNKNNEYKCVGGYYEEKNCAVGGDPASYLCQVGYCQSYNGECKQVYDDDKYVGDFCEGPPCMSGVACQDNDDCTAHDAKIRKDGIDIFVCRDIDTTCYGGHNHDEVCRDDPDRCGIPFEAYPKCLDNRKLCVGSTEVCTSDAACLDNAGVCNFSGAKIPRYYPVLRDDKPGYYWDPPEDKCVGIELDQDRPEPNNHNLIANYCGIPPKVYNIKSDKYEIYSNKFINLTFNTNIDKEQLPLVSYEVDWGDEEMTLVSGVEMIERPQEDYPHSLYHVYNYWDLKNKSGKPNSPVVCKNKGSEHEGLKCEEKNCCFVKIRVRIRDNWDWCNKGDSRNDCGHWNYLGEDLAATPKWIKIYE